MRPSPHGARDTDLRALAAKPLPPPTPEPFVLSVAALLPPSLSDASPRLSAPAVEPRTHALRSLAAPSLLVYSQASRSLGPSQPEPAPPARKLRSTTTSRASRASPLAVPSLFVVWSRAPPAAVQPARELRELLHYHLQSRMRFSLSLSPLLFLCSYLAHSDNCRTPAKPAPAAAPDHAASAIARAAPEACSQKLSSALSPFLPSFSAHGSFAAGTCTWRLAMRISTVRSR